MSLAFLRPFSGPCQTSHCPLSRLQARSTFFFHILSPSLIVATWPLRTPRAVSLFIRVNEVESRRSIEGTTINEHLCKFYQPLFPIRVRDIISPASIYFISSFSKHFLLLTLWIRRRNRFFKFELENIENISTLLTILSKLLISKEIWYGNQASKRPYRVSGVRAPRPVRCPFCMRKSYTPREVKFGSGSRWSAERVSGLETR